MAPILAERIVAPTTTWNQFSDMYLETKRKASEQLGSESPSKRIKNSHSHTISPDIEGKARVVPFPEKVSQGRGRIA